MAAPSRPDEKLTALREHGAVNPRAQAVTDEAFAAHAFFDPRDLVQVKYEMVRRVHTEGQTVTRAAATFGFSRQSFYQAEAAVVRAGLPGLVPQRRGPRGPHKLREDVLAFLEELKSREPTLRSRDLAERVRERFGLTVHPRTIERGLARRQKKLPGPTPWPG